MPDAGASDATSCAAVVRRLPPATAVAMVNTAAAAAVEGIADNGGLGHQFLFFRTPRQTSVTPARTGESI